MKYKIWYRWVRKRSVLMDLFPEIKWQNCIVNIEGCSPDDFIERYRREFPRMEFEIEGPLDKVEPDPYPLFDANGPYKLPRTDKPIIRYGDFSDDIKDWEHPGDKGFEFITGKRPVDWEAELRQLMKEGK